MLKNKCSVWKRIKFPTFWYNCYYFTWSETYSIQLETLLINHPSYFIRLLPSSLSLHCSAPSVASIAIFSLPSSFRWFTSGGSSNTGQHPDDWSASFYARQLPYNCTQANRTLFHSNFNPEDITMNLHPWSLYNFQVRMEQVTQELPVGGNDMLRSFRH